MLAGNVKSVASSFPSLLHLFGIIMVGSGYSFTSVVNSDRLSGNVTHAIEHPIFFCECKGDLLPRQVPIRLRLPWSREVFHAPWFSVNRRVRQLCSLIPSFRESRTAQLLGSGCWRDMGRIRAAWNDDVH